MSGISYRKLLPVRKNEYTKYTRKFRSITYESVVSNIIKIPSFKSTAEPRRNTPLSSLWQNKTSSCAMSFDLGPISHKVYGEANNLVGELPLVLPDGTYKLSSVLSEPDRFKNLVNDFVPKCEGLWSTANCLTMIQDVIIITACLNPPQYEIEDSPMRVQILGWLFGYAIDDIADSAKSISRLLSYKRFVQLWNYWIKWKDPKLNIDVIEDFPILIRSKKMVAVKNISRHFFNEIVNCTPTMLEQISSGVCIQKHFDCISSILLHAEMLRNSTTFANLNNELELFRNINFMLGFAELVAICHNIEVHPAIRETILFKLVLNSFRDISTWHNSILGLQRDVCLNNVSDSLVLTWQKKYSCSLQQAFDMNLEILLSSYADFEMTAQKLCMVYAEDESVLRYVEMLKYVLDGWLYAYPLLSRYGLENKMQIVKRK